MTIDNMPSIGVEMFAPEFNSQELDLHEYIRTSERNPIWELRRYYLQFPNVHIAIQELEKFQKLLRQGYIYSVGLHNNVLANMLDVTINKLMNERKFYEYRLPKDIPVKICVK